MNDVVSRGVTGEHCTTPESVPLLGPKREQSKASMSEVRLVACLALLRLTKTVCPHPAGFLPGNPAFGKAPLRCFARSVEYQSAAPPDSRPADRCGLAPHTFLLPSKRVRPSLPFFTPNSSNVEGNQRGWQVRAPAVASPVLRPLTQKEAVCYTKRQRSMQM